MDAWWTAPYVDRRTYLLGEFQHLKLTPEEFLLILMIDYLMEFEHQVSPKTLAEYLGKEEKEVIAQLSDLMDKGWIDMKVTNKNIVYSLEPVFLKKPILAIPKTLFDLFEEHFARPLTSSEMNRLSGWMQKYDNRLIEWGLREAIVYKKIGFGYIDKLLNKWYLEGTTAEQLDHGGK